MGSARWSTSDWSSYTTSTSKKSRDEIFTNRSLDDGLDPKKAAVRESRDSDANPNSTAVIVAVDVTGSMGMLAEELVRRGLNTTFTEILDRKPVTDPHLMVMAIGDADYDRVPLQVSQFEADIKIAEQLEKIYLEGHGGGNDHESYDLPWYFAAMHTSIDCFEKRGKKGYLFTVGDEMPSSELLASNIKKVIGDDVQADLPARDLLTMVERSYHVFHIVVEEGSFARRDPRRVLNAWADLLGQRAIPLKDHTKLAEVIVSTIQVCEGTDRDAVVGSWSGSTALVVAAAIKGVPAAVGGAGSTDVVRF